MPTILDATVVASAYATSASARPQRLSNGWIVSTVLDTANYLLKFYVSKDNFATPATLLCTWARTGTAGTVVFAVTSNKNMVYVVNGVSNLVDVAFTSFDATTVVQGSALVTQTSPDAVAGNQNGVYGVTIIADNTNVHFASSAINTSYINSKNIRYAKGSIATDGSVAWGAVEQVTKYNGTNYDAKNPSIVLDKNGIPLIIAETPVNGSMYITVIKPTGLSVSVNMNWTYSTVYFGSTYAQSSPSAIFVPQSVNGLANGRIWVVWHGTDSVDTAATNIRNSYSDDGGATWSAMQKVTSGNLYSQLNPSVTCNKQNKIFTVWHGRDEIAINNIKKTNNVDGTITKLTNNTTSSSTDPSTLYDSAFNFAEPLFIYKNAQTAKVGLYGTWTVTTISVTQGSIGQKTDKSNVLTYAITTDGVMSSITEKVNGVTIGTKTATSGQSQIAGLTQAQWDAVKFGKYKDITAGLNTLTITMGEEVFTYTFDKRPASDADMLSVAKAVQDSANVYLPAVKSKLVAKVGGIVTDTFENIIDDVIIGKKYATGYITSNTTALSFKSPTNATISARSIEVTGIGFKPEHIVISLNAPTTTQEQIIMNTGFFANTNLTNTRITRYSLDSGGGAYASNGFLLDGIIAYVTESAFRLPVTMSAFSYKWEAWGE